MLDCSENEAREKRQHYCRFFFLKLGDTDRDSV
jgi:hypothetical protein